MTDPVSVTQLLPCPLCQSPALSGETFDDGCYVSCMRDECKCIVGYFDTLSEAITAWNTRTTPDTRPAAAGSVRIVPVEPTPEMLSAAYNALSPKMSVSIHSLPYMLAAAPTPDAAASASVKTTGEAVAYAPKGHLERYLKGRNTACWVYGSPTAEDNDVLYRSAPDAAASEAGEVGRVRITQLMVDAALDAEWATDAGGDAPAIGLSYSVREALEEFGANLSTLEIENAMSTALAAALNPPIGKRMGDQLGSGGTAMTEDEFRTYVTALVEQTCGSTAALARKHKIHPKALTLFLSGARGPSTQVARAFGFERRYVALTTQGGVEG